MSSYKQVDSSFAAQEFACTIDGSGVITPTVNGGGSGGGGGAVTVADGADTTQGTTTDAAVVTDANGTVSAKLRGLVKLLASVISGSKLQIRALTSVDVVTAQAQDGAGNALTSTGAALDVNLKTSALGGALEAGGNLAAVAAVEGTTSDAGVVTNANGTVSAKLRGLVTLLASVISSSKLQTRALTSVDVVTVIAQDGSGNALTSTSSALDVNAKTIATAALPAVTPGTSVKQAFTGTSAQTSALTATLVRVVGTTDCHLAFGSSPTAIADGTCVFLPASTPEYFKVTSGNKIAVIQDAAAGNLFITIGS